MDNKRTLFFSIIAVLIIGLIVSGGTFAYFQWSTGDSQRTSVNVTIEHGGITMHIEPEQTEFVGLYPVDDCTKNVRYADTLVTVVNNTGTLAIPSFKLKAKVVGTPDPYGTYSQFVRYAVVALGDPYIGEDIPEKGLPIGGNSVDGFVTGDCNNPLNISDEEDIDDPSGYVLGQDFFGQSLIYGWSASANFADYYYWSESNGDGGPGLENHWKDYAPAELEYLPRFYSVNKSHLQGVTFKATQYATTKQWYRVYVWVDSGYTTTIVGNNQTTDPLQDLKIEVAWSENSIIQQVVGS